MKYRKVNIKDVMAVIARLIVFIIIEIGTALILVPTYIVVWIGILILLMIWIINWHCGVFGYECQKCKHKQTISFLKEFWSLNLVNRKYLKCAKCHKWSRAKLLVVDKK
jgi:hypothetical protein